MKKISKAIKLINKYSWRVGWEPCAGCGSTDEGQYANKGYYCNRCKDKGMDKKEEKKVIPEETDTGIYSLFIFSNSTHQQEYILDGSIKDIQNKITNTLTNLINILHPDNCILRYIITNSRLPDYKFELLFSVVDFKCMEIIFQILKRDTPTTYKLMRESSFDVWKKNIVDKIDKALKRLDNSVFIMLENKKNMGQP